MVGNVWEWVADWYDSGYYAFSPKGNPKGPDSGEYRVLRGGSWEFDYPGYMRASFRDGPGGVWYSYGFRCARGGLSCPEAKYCTVRDCGPDPVCGESCGTCPSGKTCNNGKCGGCRVDAAPPSIQCGPSPTGIGGDMCQVPAGSFCMGCNEAVDSQCWDWEKPYHEINLDAFEIDKYEVTAKEYQACADAGGCTAADTEYGACTYNVSGKESHPINCVDWDQANAYCAWAGKRLPTEAEWEKAARGTDGRMYPWGNDSLDCEHAVHSASGCSNSSTAPVGSKPKGVSPYGAEDMVGNVWEWCADWYGHSYYASSPIDNPKGPASGDGRVVRGGSWTVIVTDSLRADTRTMNDPAGSTYYVGFRCSRSPR
jgi:formylglycine-generating enzyme required for sulfatase activity